jgi:hypothetical protein
MCRRDASPLMTRQPVRNWLAAPLSREVVVPGSPGQLIVLGGLTPAGTSASGVYVVRTATGAARQIGTLSAPLHDAAGVISGGAGVPISGWPRRPRRLLPGHSRVPAAGAGAARGGPVA